MKHYLTEKDLKLARAIAYKRNTLFYNEDTLSGAYYGLVKASNTFNKERGVKFSTYAYRVINTTITEELNRMRMDLGNSHIWRATRVGERPELHSQVTEDSFFKYIPIEDNNAESISSKQDRDMVIRYLKRLPDEERMVLEMRYGLNDTWRIYTRKEIASRLKTSIPTIERRERRGLRKLRSWMKIEGVLDVYA